MDDKLELHGEWEKRDGGGLGGLEVGAGRGGTDRAADGKEAARGRRPHRRLLGRVCGVDGGIQAERIVFTTDFA